mmetsp:Transcript_9965/g.17457  ORF Transcript_9965/g.17457 Transcript_9965/m.17457 type:complete len:308 (+) Transcript_9965:243-1166(+)
MVDFELEAIETAFLSAKFEVCAKECTKVLQSKLDVSKATTSKIEIEPHAKEEVASHLKVGVIFIQCLYEMGSDSHQLQLVDRFLRQNGPLPFEIVTTWLNLRNELGHHEYVKEILERFMARYAERVKRSGVATPEMCHQYTELATLYTVDTLVSLGEAESAQRFLAMHSSSALLPREKRQEILHLLNQEIASREATEKSGLAERTENGSSSPQTQQLGGQDLSSNASERGDTSGQNQGTGGSASPRRRKKDRKSHNGEGGEDPALVLTKQQVQLAAGSAAVVVILLLQRQRLARMTSGIANFLFSGT